MSTKIRLSRGGAKKKPFYRIIVTDSKSPRDGSFIEKLGTYNPMLNKDHPERVVISADRMNHWLNLGAQPSESVLRFITTKHSELPKFVTTLINKKEKIVQLKRNSKKQEEKNQSAAIEQ